MHDFFEDVGGELKRWIDYYGEHSHDDPGCAELGKTVRRARTDRPPCPECTNKGDKSE